MKAKVIIPIGWRRLRKKEIAKEGDNLLLGLSLEYMPLVMGDFWVDECVGWRFVIRKKRPAKNV